MYAVAGSILDVSSTGDLNLLKDQVILVNGSGHIEYLSSKSTLPSKFSQVPVTNYDDAWILPPFVDSHIHFPQLDIIGCHSGTLLSWLETLTFPTEAKFNAVDYAKPAADAFCEELCRNGVGAAMVFSSSDYGATEVLFESFAASGMRAIAGRSSMNRMAPESILVDVAEDAQSTQSLINSWHGFDDRLYVALTPRFAPSVTEPLLASCSKFLETYPDLYVQTHISETQDEIDLVKQLFPDAKDYLSVYEDYGLLGDRTVLAHGIYLTASERHRVIKTGSLISHCPTSNFFLGSGLFPYLEHSSLGGGVLLGSDIGAGTSFSPWRTMGEAYKVSKLLGGAVAPGKLLYDSTLGAASLLKLASGAGITVGAPADFQVLEPFAQPLMARRKAQQLDQIVGGLMYLADDRNLKQIYVQGRPLI